MSKIRGRSSAIGSHGTVWVPWAFPIQELRLREETQALGAGGVPATSFHRLQTVAKQISSCVGRGLAWFVDRAKAHGTQTVPWLPGLNVKGRDRFQARSSTPGTALGRQGPRWIGQR